LTNWRPSYNKESLLLVSLNKCQHSYHQTTLHSFCLPWKGFLGISEKPRSKYSTLSTVLYHILSMFFLSLISQIYLLLLHALWWFYISITFDFLFVFLQSNYFFSFLSFCFVYFFAGFNFWARRSKRKLELIFWKMKASTKIKVLKNMVNKKSRKNSTVIISVWTGLKGKKTEPNRIEINRFESVFGSVQFKNLKKQIFGLVVYFGRKPDRIENAQP